MANLVCMGGMLQCSFGAAPGPLIVLPAHGVLTGTPAATIMDHVPLVNVPPFGVCMSPSNPVVITATAAALDDASKLMCLWGGVIQISVAGQFTTQVP